MKVIKRISLFAFVVLTFFISVCIPILAYAEDYTTIMEEVPYDYDTSSVIADLNDGVEVPESEFVPTKYLNNIFSNSLDQILQGNFNFTQDIYVISFIENGYGTDNFGLYLYVYNPNNLDILSSSDKNKVQFSVSDKENDVFRSAYSKYNLALIDKTENNLYYKFKVEDFSLSNYSERYYAVSGIELHIDGNGNATEYVVGSVYYCYSNNSGNTTISRKPLSTIDVDCTHVYYRTDDSDKGRGYSNQLSACYFSLPKEYSFGNNLYGKLTEILAEFDLRYTKPILLLNNESVYQKFVSVLGKTMPVWSFIDGHIDWDLVSLNGLCFWCGRHQGPLHYIYDIGFNFIGASSPYNESFFISSLDTLYWAFCDTTADFDNEDYYYSAENLRNYAYGIKDISIERFNALFEDEQYFINEELSLCGFNYGYNRHTYSISQDPEQGAVLGYELTFDAHGFWDSIYEFFGGNATETVSGIAPLVRVEYSDISLSDEDFSEKYLVAKQQVADLKTKLALAQVNQEEVWLFRYDCSEYYGAKAEVYIHKDEDGVPTGTCYDGLVCQEPVYLDWDILSFTFEQSAVSTETQGTKVVKTTVPVNHSPEDVYHDLTRSKNDFDKGCGCTDYGSILTWIMFFSAAFVVWWLITKIGGKFRGK